MERQPPDSRSDAGEDCALRSFVASIRREYLDRVPYRSARDLQRKLVLFKEYYNSDRVHRGLDGAPPLTNNPEIRTVRSLAWTNIGGKSAAVVCISSRQRLAY